MSAASEKPVAQFIDDGRRYVVRDVHLVDQGQSHLFNDTMEFCIDLRGKTEARFVQPNSSTYGENVRSFFVRDDETGEFWSVPFEPVQREPDSYEFNAGLSDIQWRITTCEIEAHLRVVIPRADQVELWTITLTNKSSRPRKISLYTYFPIGLITWISQVARYDSKLGGIVFDYFPYYVKVDDYYKLKRRKNFIFLAGDRQPSSFETNLREFLGGKAPHNPGALAKPLLGGSEVFLEAVANAMQYPLELGPGASDSLNFAYGPAQDRKDIARLVRTYLKPGGVDKALAKVQAYLQKIQPNVRVQTPDADFNHYVNHWLPQQAHFCGGLQRISNDPCVRNLFQDTMGITFTMPQKARYWYLTVFAHQHKNGFMPHGAPLAADVDRTIINTIPHRDMNVWAPLALDFYINETGDLAILNHKVPFQDSRTSKTVYDHVCLGLGYQLKDRTRRGLCRIGQGDWDDPLNMAGHKNKGESIWLTEALAFALDTWARVADLRGDRPRAASYRRQAGECRNAINALAWRGKWYARGTTDAGLWFGTHKDKEGKIFLNAQSWALMCGAADSPKRIRQCIDAVNKHLMTPSGPMTMAPGFTSMREDIGKITQKTPGTQENGAVYCHAATFYAYGLFRVRQADEGFRVLRMLLTGGQSNPLSRSQQFPLFIPNYYNGLQCGRAAGRGSAFWPTGTAAWFYRTVVNELLGIKGQLDGLRIDPQLPSTWDHACAWRNFRGAQFNITIQRNSAVDQPQVTLDGNLLPTDLIPLQKPGTTHEVDVLIPISATAEFSSPLIPPRI